MSRKIKLTNEDYRKAKDFAMATHKHHARRGRNNTEVINNIIQAIKQAPFLFF